MRNQRKQVLFAHQSTIPHYRVDFYNQLQKIKGDAFDFTVVFDEDESERYFFTRTDPSTFTFPVLNTKTANFKILKREAQFQNFVFKLKNYDMIIVGSAVGNLTYPFVFISKLLGKKLGIWGKSRDYEKKFDDQIIKLSEKFKIQLANWADCFFAYTNSVKKYLTDNKVQSDKIFVINNTIDVQKQRETYESLKDKRAELRAAYNLTDKKVLLHVGRLIKNKKIDFLLEAFNTLYKKDKDYTLVCVGSGEKETVDNLRKQYSENQAIFTGFVPDDELAKYFVISDLYTFPGTVGLGPLQPICFNVIPVVIDSDIHSAEYEYFNDRNALILKQNTSAQDYAEAIYRLMNNQQEVEHLKNTAFASISHLTLENMAQKFIDGINYCFNKN